MSNDGRFWVVNGKRKFLVEPIGTDRPADWGSYNPASGQIENKKGFGKYTGAIEERDSVISEKNGFKNIVTISGSPLSYIHSQLLK